MEMIVLDGVLGDFTPERVEIVRKLMTREWYKNTPEEERFKLISLPQTGKENHDGFLADLAARPESMGGITVLRLEKLQAGNFALIPVFMVRNNESGKEYPYEYVSWRYGPASGVKALVLVEDEEGLITDFIVLRSWKFATGQEEFDLVGGFADIGVEEVKTVLDRFAVEIREELGVPDIIVNEVIDLGDILVDAGMTNNRPKLVAAIIDGSEAARVSKEQINIDPLELKAGPLVLPISQIQKMMANSTDMFFLGAVAKAIGHGVINI